MFQVSLSLNLELIDLAKLAGPQALGTSWPPVSAFHVLGLQAHEQQLLPFFVSLLRGVGNRAQVLMLYSHHFINQVISLAPGLFIFFNAAYKTEVHPHSLFPH